MTTSTPPCTPPVGTATLARRARERWWGAGRRRGVARFLWASVGMVLPTHAGWAGIYVDFLEGAAHARGWARAHLEHTPTPAPSSPATICSTRSRAWGGKGKVKTGLPGRWGEVRSRGRASESAVKGLQHPYLYSIARHSGVGLDQSTGDRGLGTEQHWCAPATCGAAAKADSFDRARPHTGRLPCL